MDRIESLRIRAKSSRKVAGISSSSFRSEIRGNGGQPRVDRLVRFCQLRKGIRYDIPAV